MYIKRFFIFIGLIMIFLTLIACTQRHVVKDKLYIIAEEHANITIKDVNILKSLGKNLSKSEATSLAYSILNKYFEISPKSIISYDTYVVYNNEKRTYTWNVYLRNNDNNIYLVSIDTISGLVLHIDTTGITTFTESQELLSRDDVLIILKNFFREDIKNIKLIDYTFQNYMGKVNVSINNVSYFVLIDTHSKKVDLIYKN